MLSIAQNILGNTKKQLVRVNKNVVRNVNKITDEVSQDISSYENEIRNLEDKLKDEKALRKENEKLRDKLQTLESRYLEGIQNLTIKSDEFNLKIMELELQRESTNNMETENIDDTIDELKSDMKNLKRELEIKDEIIKELNDKVRQYVEWNDIERKEKNLTIVKEVYKSETKPINIKHKEYNDRKKKDLTEKKKWV